LIGRGSRKAIRQNKWKELYIVAVMPSAKHHFIQKMDEVRPVVKMII
jgi:hypothetical protein